MRILLVGGNGQVGQELRRSLVDQGNEVLVTTRTGSLPEGGECLVADLNNPDSLATLVGDVKPDVVVNAAAYTAVDKAQDDSEAAFRVNAESPGVLARACAELGCLLVHYSTDYVFNGQGKRAYVEDDATDPLGVYGASKLAGEQAIIAAGGRYMIFRTAWVYATHGHNFMRTMLRLGAERDELKVVGDQIGSPTPAAMIADATAIVIAVNAFQVLDKQMPRSGIWHLTTTGQASWADFAQAIFERAHEVGKLERLPKVTAITTQEYPTPTQRPAFSCLDTQKFTDDFELHFPDWRDALNQVLVKEP